MHLSQMEIEEINKFTPYKKSKKKIYFLINICQKSKKRSNILKPKYHKSKKNIMKYFKKN